MIFEMVITSKDNETIKDIKKLKEKKYRYKEKSFIVEGTKMIEEAINEKAQIKLIVLKEHFENNVDIMQLNEKIKKLNIRTIEVSENIFNTLTEVVSPQGILAIIKKDMDNQEIDYSQNFFIALDGIQDPGNLGTIIRTIDAANLKQIIIAKNSTVDPYSPKVIRATMGAIFRVNVIQADDLATILQETKKQGFKIISTYLQTKNNIYDINYDKSVVVIGNEANGISMPILDISDKKVKIPMLGKTESLNAAVSAGIMIYEYVRNKF